MEIYNTIAASIATIGFPIAMALMEFLYITKQAKAHNDEIRELVEALKDTNHKIDNLVDFVKMLLDKDNSK